MGVASEIKKKIEEKRKENDRKRENLRKQRHTERIKAAGRERAQLERQEVLAAIDVLMGEDAPDEARIAELKLRAQALHAKAQERDAAHDHAKDRASELRSQIAWNVKRLTTLRKKLKEAQQQSGDPHPESWHGNGHEWWNLTDRAKKLLAIAVVRYGCYCTSITRDWGTGSHHEYVPTRGFDCAGSRMQEFQEDLRYGRVEGFGLGDLLELFGPNNAACADNGQPYAMAEGSGIEQLHDNHTHAFVYGA